METYSIRIRICDVPVEVQCAHERNMDFFHDYLTEDEPWFSIQAGIENIEEMRNLFLKDNPSASYSEWFLENNALHKLLAEGLLSYDVLLMHGSALAMDGECYIFSAPSGTGKSTHARLWRKVFGDRVVMINDDKPMIRFINGKPYVYGTPWDGKHHLSSNTHAPLKAFVKLDRGMENTIGSMKGSDGILFLMMQTYRSKNKQKMKKILELYNQLIATCKMYHLYCNMEDEAAIIAYEGMKEKKNETQG